MLISYGSLHGTWFGLFHILHSVSVLTMNSGPCRVVNDTSTEFHPESWNSNANVFFVDQPVGVGFSYAEYGEHVVRLLCHPL